MAAPNGINNGGAAPYPLGGVMANAGQHNDINYVWGLVEELSALLQANREKWQDLQAGIARAQIRPQDHAEGVNGDVNGTTIPGTSAQDHIADLTIKLSEAEKMVMDLESTVTAQMRTSEDYTACLEKIKSMVHNYIYEQQQASIAIHTHYNTQLEQARNETLQAQLTHQAWQASLSRVSEYVRLAMKEKSDDSLPYRKKIAALKEENRLLRSRAGWDPLSDSEDEEEGTQQQQQQHQGGHPGQIQMQR